MSLRAGFRAGWDSLTATPASSTGRTVEASALLGPTDPAPELASPWTDRTALQSVVWSDLINGADPDLVPLTRREAMGVPAIARARGLVANSIGMLPLLAMRGTAELAAPDPAAVFLRQPDPGQSRFIQVTWTVDDLIFQGVSWWLTLDRYASGRPSSARRILPGGVIVDDGGKVTVYGRPTDPANLIRIDGPHEGILCNAARTIRSAASIERSVARFAANPVPAVELHQTDDAPMTDPEIQSLIQGWADARAGKNGGVAYTSRNIDAKVHGAPAENLLTVGRNASAIDCARHVGVPADAVDASLEHASMTYGTVVEKSRTLIDFGLAHYAEAITARLSLDDVLPAGTLAAFRFGDLTAASDVNPNSPAPPAPDPGAPPAGGVTA